MTESSWGVVPQTQNMEYSWPETPASNLRAENWGNDRPSAPSENNQSTKKPAQESWGQNKSENSWISRNDTVQVDHPFTNRSLPEKEPAKLSNNLPSVNLKSASSYDQREEEEENLVNFELQTVLQRSYESFKDEEQFATELDEDRWDPSYDSVPISSSKPQLAIGRVEPLTISSNSRLYKKEFRDVEVQTDPIDLSTIIASKEKLLSCTIDSQIRRDYQQRSQASSRSITSSVSEKSYPPQQSITPSLLDVDPEEWNRLNKNTKVENTEDTWITSSNKPDFDEDSTVIPPTKPDTNVRALDNDSLGSKPIQTPPNNDSNWVSKPQETQQVQSIPVEPDTWGPSPSVQINSWDPTPPVQPDSRTVPQQIPVQNNDLNVTSQPIQNNNWHQQPSRPKDIVPQEAPKESWRAIPNESWPKTQDDRMTPQEPLNVSNDNRNGSNINKEDSWNKGSQPYKLESSAQANELPKNSDSWGDAPTQPAATWSNPNINKEPQPHDTRISTQTNELPKNSDRWGNAPTQPADATWSNPQSNISKEPQPRDIGISAQTNELPKNSDSWGNAPTQPADATWSNPKSNIKEPQPRDIGISAQTNELPKNSNSWGNAPTQPAGTTWSNPQSNIKEPQPRDIGISAQTNELPKNSDSWDNAPTQPADATWNNPQSNINKEPQPRDIGISAQINELPKNSDSWGNAPVQPADATWGNQQPNVNKADSWSAQQTAQNIGGSTNDWTKQAEQFSKELGENGEKSVKETQWGQTGYEAGQKAEDSYGTGAYDSYSSNNRYGNRGGGCHNCGQEGHFARDCPEKKQAYGGGRSCHKCGKEGHMARDCTEENGKSGYGGGYSGGRPCHKCGKEGHFARDCTEEGGYGGGYGGGRSCHKCGKEGHMARDCTEEGGYGGGYGGGRPCHKCGKEGHFARDCTEEGGYGGGYGGGRPCHKCGKEGHFARDCTEENGKGGYGGYSGGRPCHKCGKEGHFARECTESGGAYGGGYGGGGNPCYKCNKPGHRPNECNEDAYETTGEPERSREFNAGGQSRFHTKLSPFSNPEPSDISSQDAWARLLKADKEKDLDDFKDALELYAKVTPEETFQTIEKRLRAANCNGRIIALEREILLNKVLVDLQGNTNKKYVANPIMCHPSRLARTAGTRANDESENIEWLGDSGFMVDDTSPICFNCKQKGHTTKDCPEPKREIEKQPSLGCQNCGSSDHMTKFCPQERRDYYAEARDRKAGGSYNRDSVNDDRASSGYDGEDKGFRGYGSNSGTCHNCNREGHISRDCPEPRRGRKCHKCGEEGHLSKDCTSSSGGDYDRGSYNGSSTRQKDSSSWNNNKSAPWSQDRSGKSDNNFQENSWNKVRNEQENSWNKSGGDYNKRSDNASQENSWNKSGGDYNRFRSGNSSQENSWNKPGGGGNATSSRDDYRNTQNQGGSYTSSTNDNARDSSLPAQDKGGDTPRQNDNQPASNIAKDSWDNTEITTKPIVEWGYKTAEDFWPGNKTSAPDDNENKQSRGNESYNKGPDDYENRRDRSNGSYNKGPDDYERRGRSNGSYNKGPDDYERRGRSNGSHNKGPDDYERRGRGSESYNRGPDDRGRGNESYNKGPYDYDNRRSRGNESYNRGPDDYEGRGRGNESYSKGPQEPQEQNTKSNPNLDNVSAWW